MRNPTHLATDTPRTNPPRRTRTACIAIDDAYRRSIWRRGWTLLAAALLAALVLIALSGPASGAPAIDDKPAAAQPVPTERQAMNQTVPEPAALTLTLLGGLVTLGLRRRS